MARGCMMSTDNKFLATVLAKVDEMALRTDLTSKQKAFYLAIGLLNSDIAEDIATKETVVFYDEGDVIKEFLDEIRLRVNYWARQDKYTDAAKCDGVAFSILTLLDGCGGGAGGYKVKPLATPLGEIVETCAEGGIAYPEDCYLPPYLHELYYSDEDDDTSDKVARKEFTEAICDTIMTWSGIAGDPIDLITGAVTEALEIAKHEVMFDPATIRPDLIRTAMQHRKEQLHATAALVLAA